MILSFCDLIWIEAVSFISKRSVLILDWDWEGKIETGILY